MVIGDLDKGGIDYQLTSGGFCVRPMVGLDVGLLEGILEGDLGWTTQFGPAAQKELDGSLGVSW